MYKASMNIEVYILMWIFFLFYKKIRTLKILSVAYGFICLIKITFSKYFHNLFYLYMSLCILLSAFKICLFIADFQQCDLNDS